MNLRARLSGVAFTVPAPEGYRLPLATVERVAAAINGRVAKWGTRAVLSDSGRATGEVVVRLELSGAEADLLVDVLRVIVEDEVGRFLRQGE